MSVYQRLLDDDYVPYAPDTPGASVAMPHKSHCDNGTDHKSRLVIKRFPDGVIKAFCHNCQSAGVHRPEDYVRHISDILEPDDPDTLIILPKDVVPFAEAPNDVKAELFKYDITYEEAASAQLCWSPQMKRLIHPIYDSIGNLRRWEGRNFSNQPKYIKQRIPGATDLFKAHYGSSESVVLVEDYVSAIRCAREIHAVALGGVTIHTDELVKLADQYDNLLVFLDDDNPTVLEAAGKIVLDAQPLFNKVSRVENPAMTDPKRYDRNELNVLLSYKGV